MKKIVISVISISLVLIIGISALVLSLIPNGLSDTIKKPDEVIIVCSQTKDFSPDALTYKNRDENDRDVITNIYSMFYHAFEQNTLSAIFKGELNKNLESNYLEKGSKTISSNINSEDKITVCFKYNENQKIKDFDYKYLFFEISNVNERAEIVFGVKTSLNTLDNNYYFNYYYTGKANFAKLYNYILDLI